MIRGTDGLDYEDLTAKLLGQPAKTTRNERLQGLASHSPAFRRAYAEIYDVYTAKTPGRDSLLHIHHELRAHRAAFQHACIESSAADNALGLSARDRGAW